MTESVEEPRLPSPKERRGLREAAGLTYEAVATAVGVRANTVRSWESGRTHPRGRKHEAYAAFLKSLAAASAASAAPDAAPAKPDPDATRAAGAGPQDTAPAGAGAGAAPAAPGTPPDSAPAPARATAAAPPSPPPADPTGAKTAAPGAAGPQDTAPAGPGAAPAAVAADARTAPTAAAPRGSVAASAEVPGDTPSAGAPDPAGAVPGGTSAGGAAVRMPGAMRPFGMSGHGPRTRPPVAAKRAAKPPTATPRHEAKFTVKATARAIGTPGLATSGPTGPLPYPTPAEAEACEQPPSGPESHGPAPGEASGQATTGATAAGTATAPPEGHGQAPVETPPHPAPAAAATAADSDTAEPAPAETTGQAPATDASATPGEPGQAAVAPGPPGPGAVFDALYQYAAPALARQAYLLTGRRRLAQEAVDRAFQQAWARWPEVAIDPDPVGWVRAAAYEYALSPWHGLRRAHKHPDKAPTAPADRILMDAMLALPPAHRRTVLLYDGVGLDLPDTAAETEASTPTAGNRLLHAHAALADRIPELAAAPAEKQSAVLRERLGAVTPAVPLEPRPAAAVRFAAEYRATRLTRAFLGLTAVIAVATAYTTATAPRQYEPPIAPGASVSGVPPLAGPQRLTDETRQLRERLRAHPAHRPERLAPSLE
ncbi:helix-turn-helix domain-containing protein [Streptomyces sp. NPDC090741]|uniref:helix-turn-helix domain-containing protein n=1 Tax=Streptomyces sp. NPDC090741 TaxID=3365967 RepID=UPI0037FE96A5